MRQVTGFVILMGASAFLACAAQTPATTSAPAPAQTPATTSAAAPAQAPAASPASTDGSQSAKATATATAATASTAPQKIAIPAGYRHKTANGQDLYCRTDPVPNSRAQRVETCLTQDQLDARNRSSTDYMEQVQRQGGLVTGTGGGMPSGGLGR
jgi:hypothetical protein